MALTLQTRKEIIKNGCKNREISGFRTFQIHRANVCIELAMQTVIAVISHVTKMEKFDW